MMSPTWLWLIEQFKKLQAKRYTSFFGYEPCDTGTIWERIATPLIGQLECKCCILWRGIIIGAISTSLFNWIIL